MRQSCDPKRPLVTVAINNFNYGRFLAAAIDSVLAQTYSNIQVVVVDDGSTDESRKVLLSYAERVQIVLKENGGQGSCYNAGFSSARGELILFLDADDYLAPNMIERVVSVWEPSISKVQVLMEVVDENGDSCGYTVPTIKPNDDVAKDLAARFGTYVSPPGSGNVFRRDWLHSVFPLEASRWTHAADSVPILPAPFFGRIVSILEPLAFYRRHGSGHSDFAQIVPGSDTFKRKLERAFAADMQRNNFVLSRFGDPTEVRPGSLRYCPPNLLKLRIAIFREGLPVPSKGMDSRKAIISGIFGTLRYWHPFALYHRALFALLCLIMLFGPIGISRRAFLFGISPHRRRSHGWSRRTITSNEKYKLSNDR